VSIVDRLVLDALVAEAERSPPGCIVEVGVYRGGSAIRLHGIAVAQQRELHLFDTFCGMPFQDSGDMHAVGDFGDHVSLPTLRQAMPHATFHVGIFPHTLTTDVSRIAFAHVDCDQYRSTVDCIDRLRPLMVDGGVMWFDDFADVPSARKAVLDRFSEDDLLKAPNGRVFVRISA